MNNARKYVDIKETNVAFCPPMQIRLQYRAGCARGLKENKMKKYVLQEFMNLDYSDELLNEKEREGNKSGIHLVLAGKIQSAGQKNGNGRIYPKPILEREMKNYQKLVKEVRAIGELDHPDSSVVELKNASHLVTEVWWDGGSVMGKVQVLNTPSGNILKGLVDSGVSLGISSRGLGSVK